MHNTYWLTQLQLESSLVENDDGTLSTRTEEAHLLIKEGIISKIQSTPPPDDQIPRISGKGQLALPAFHDHHVHLDKGFYGGPWKACTPFVSVADRIREEETFLEDFLTNTEERAESLIDLLTSRGIASARVHVNVDPVIGLGNVERIGAVLDRNRHRLDAELVAFPQHGLLKSGVPRLMICARTLVTSVVS